MHRARIYTEGGAGIGFGHVARCVALYDAMREHSIEAEMVVAGDATVHHLFGERVVTVGEWTDAAYLERTSLSATISVIDSYRATEEVYRQIAAASRISLYVDDFERLQYPDGIVLRPSPVVPPFAAVRPDAARLLCGPEYHLIRREFWDLETRQTVVPVVGRVLVTLGGTAPSELFAEMRELVFARFSDAEVTIVTGHPQDETGDRLTRGGIHATVLGSVGASTMRDLMLQSDVAVSAAGQTMYELSRCGVPVVAIAIADNQRDNLAGFVAGGAALSGGGYPSGRFRASVEGALHQIEAATVRQSLSNTAKGLIDGQGPRRVVDLLLRHCE